MDFKIRDSGTPGKGTGGTDQILHHWRLLVGLVVVVFAFIILLVTLFSCIRYLGRGEIWVAEKALGKPLPAGRYIAEIGQRGIQREPIGPGPKWMLINPLVTKLRKVKLTSIPEGKLGLLHAQDGASLQEGKILADGWIDTAHQRGILQRVLTPGTYPINTFAYDVEIVDVTQIQGGFVGVVESQTGEDIPPRQLLEGNLIANENQKGVQKKVLNPGTHFINPYEKIVTKIDLRSHKDIMTGEESISFPANDAFDITTSLAFEWGIMRDKVQDSYIWVGTEEESRQQIIVPNARSIGRLKGSARGGRDFITEREKFQTDFAEALTEVVKDYYIDMRNIMVKETTAPTELVEPISLANVAIEQEQRYKQEEITAEQDIKLQMQTTKADRQKDLVDAETAKAVAIMEANQRLEVAKTMLEMEKKKAEEIRKLAQADNVVFLYQGDTLKGAFEKLIAPFGTGEAFANYTLAKNLNPNVRIAILATGKGTLWGADTLDKILQLKGYKEISETGELFFEAPPEVTIPAIKSPKPEKDKSETPAETEQKQ